MRMKQKYQIRLLRIDCNDLKARFNQSIRGHWGVENRTHYVRDTSLQEDASRIRRNPCIFALLRSFAHNLMRFNRVENISLGLYDNALSLDRVLAYEGL